MDEAVFNFDSEEEKQDFISDKKKDIERYESRIQYLKDLIERV